VCTDTADVFSSLAPLLPSSCAAGLAQLVQYAPLLGHTHLSSMESICQENAGTLASTAVSLGRTWSPPAGFTASSLTADICPETCQAAGVIASCLSGRRLQSDVLTPAETSTLRAVVMDQLPAALVEADVSILDRMPSITIFVDVGVRSTATAVIAAVTQPSFVAAIEAVLGMGVFLETEPYVVDSRTITMPRVPPTLPPSPAPSLPPAVSSTTTLLGLDSVASSNTATGSSSSNSGAIVGIVAGVVGVLVIAALIYYLWRRRQQRGMTQLHIGKMRGASLLRDEKPSNSKAAKGDVPAVAAETLDVANAATDTVVLESRLHSLHVLEPAQVDRFTVQIRQSSTGQFRVQLLQEDIGLPVTVSHVGASDIPDDRAKVVEGDMVRKINGNDISTMSLLDVRDMMSGSGIVVELTLERERRPSQAERRPSQAMHIAVETLDLEGLAVDDVEDNDMPQRDPTVQQPAIPAEAIPDEDTAVTAGPNLSLLDVMAREGVARVHGETSPQGASLPPQSPYSASTATRYSETNAEANLRRVNFNSALMRV